MSRLLIIDDDRDFSRSLQIQLELEGHTVATAHTGTAGIELAGGQPLDLVLLDLKLRETDGLEVLSRLRARGIATPVAMITGEQDMQANIQAVRQGVVEYLRKPFPLPAVLDLIARVEREQAPTDEFLPLRQVSANPREIVGADPAVLELLKQLGLLSRSQVTVLIQGESGTGKEVVGRALHQATSPDAPFVAINCTAVVESLLESELFGHLKGAFTGAHADKPGKLAAAGQGTLLLDEIGDLPLALQPKLLRVIQEREFTPVGGLRAVPFAARLVAVTHRDLDAMVKAGTFREDLYYRLAVTRLHVPPLRQRKGDIELLTHHLLSRLSRDLHRPIQGIARDALQRLQQYDWPGNVRELENVLTRAIALAKSDILTLADLNLDGGQPPAPPDAVTLAEMEQRHIAAALEANDWNITRTAERLGISRPTLRKKISDYRLKGGDED